MSTSKTSDLLRRLQDAALDDLMRTSDSELLAEILEEDEELLHFATDFKSRIHQRLGAKGDTDRQSFGASVLAGL